MKWLLVGLLTLCHLSLIHVMCQGQAIESVREVHELLHSQPLEEDVSRRLEQFFRLKYRGQDLTRPDRRHLLERTDDGGGFVAWGIESSKPVTVVAEKGRSWPLVRLPDSDLWVWAERFPNFSSVHYRFDIDGQRLGGGQVNRFGFESYQWLPESQVQEGVPQGEIVEMGTFVSEKHFPGTERRWWVYVPANYSDASPPLKLIVFNDGAGFVRGEGNACTVLDNLIHQEKVPPMLAVFVNPGSIPRSGNRAARSNRGDEYDTCTPRYANFLDDEILPLVREKYRISDDPWDHAICGSSSGASCAFTAAWHRNDLFRRVVSFVGSYCDFRPLRDYPEYKESFTLDGNQFGPWKTAHDYPGLIRKTEPRKHIKVFLQDGENDLDNSLGNWFQNNQRMASALAYGGYDYQFVAGKGMHSKKHGMSILPEILVWLWADTVPAAAN